MSVLDK